MKKTILLFLSLLICMSVCAADFKVGGAKYLVLADGTAELKEFKKAEGDVVIPEKITAPQSGVDYTVSSIGEEAFKKSNITSVTIPSTVKNIGNMAFMGCKDLVTVTMPSTVENIGDKAFRDCKNLVTVSYPENLDAIPSMCFYNCKSLKSFDLKGKKTIHNEAFKGSGLTSLDIPESVKLIGSGAFGSCPHLKSVSVQSSDEELEMHSGVMYGTPVESVFIGRPLNYKNEGVFTDKFRLYNNNPALKSLWIGPNFPVKRVHYQREDCYMIDCPNAFVVFCDEDAGEQALNLLTSMPYLPKVSFYFGVEETENGPVLSQDTAYNRQRALEVAEKNIDKEKFLKKMQEFIRVAVNEPKKLRNEYVRLFNTYEIEKYNSYVTNAMRVLCDSVYLVKPQLSEAEADNVSFFISKFLMAIGADYGKANCTIDEWALNDLLNKDIEAGAHKEDYERVLKSAERLLKLKIDNNMDIDDGGYLFAMQLAGLCGLERWEEASKMFPKFIRMYTDNGRSEYAIPYEIKYMQKAINSHGYKAVIPDFNKKQGRSSSKKQGSSSSSKINSSDIEFFMDAAINAGINHYKKKKAEKEFRELYYDSIGLDAKGRPRKRKK